MPTYKHKCLQCGHKFDEWSNKPLSISEDSRIIICPACKSKDTKRIITAPMENPFMSIDWFKFK